METIDVAVIGAGVAGLAAAGELRRQGLAVTVFEARDRIGGRILTLREARVTLPIELGAELVHGEAQETGRILREAGLLGIEVEGAAKTLARPVRKTLFFAGEATAEENGTVEGALVSGQRAARQVARALTPVPSPAGGRGDGGEGYSRNRARSSGVGSQQASVLPNQR